MSYMGEPGDKVFIDSQGLGEMKTFVLINAENFAVIDMFFSSEAEAKKYTRKQKLVLARRKTAPT